MTEYRYASMSGRPRPVTATVTKPKWMELSESSPRRHSLDSTGSTASLCSVLEHDSYISLSSDEEEGVIRHQFNDMKIEEGPLDATQDETDKTEDQSCYSSYERLSSPQTPEQKQNSHNDEFQGLSPWEKWLLIKTREERIKHKLEVRNKKMQEEKNRQEDDKKKDKLSKAEEEMKRWKERKTVQEKSQKKMEMHLKETEHDCKVKKESEIHEKAEKKYEEWSKMKKIEERQKRKEKREKLRSEREKDIEKKKISEEKYQEWCRNSKKRSLPARSNISHGYIDGKLTDYHDTNTYPEPGYYNPKPWQPIKIPKQKSTANNKSMKKPSKPRYVWNPDKYY